MSTNENGKRVHDGLIVVALATGASYAEAARIGHVSKATVARRMSEPGFRARVLEERKQAVDRVHGLLVEGSVAAAKSIIQLATEGASESARLAAACRVLDLSLRRRPGFDTYTEQEVVTMVRDVVELAIARIPDEEQESFVHEVRALGSR
jgi:transposase InsO family protein